MEKKKQEYQIGARTTSNLQNVYNYMSKNGITRLNSLKIESKPVEVVEEPKKSLKDTTEAIEEPKEQLEAIDVKSEEQKEINNTKN